MDNKQKYPFIKDKYSAEELIIEAETLEETGEYLHMDLVGFSNVDLFEEAEKRIHKIIGWALSLTNNVKP